jgi:hypothetical protein
MKKIVLLLSLFVSMGAMAQGIKTPAPSPTQTIKQDFALSSIELNYSRPLAKGRKIFGDLVPFGAMWRTGANGATKVTFGEDVKVGGVAVKAGSYALYTIPNANEWEVILNKGVNNGGLSGYKADEDVARFKVPSMSLPFSLESFTMIIADVMPNSANIQILWENTAVSIPVEANIDANVMKQIDAAMNVDNRPYFAAASYYFDNGKDMAKALEWANKAVEAQPKAYWVAHLKAKIQAKMGDKAGAKATALKSIELAKEGGNPDYVALNEKLIKTL